MPDTREPLRLWLTSRSAYEDGFFCPRSRYLQYHSGPNGYGMKRKAGSLPLTTGTYIDQPIAAILNWVQNNPGDMAGVEQVAREAIATAKAAYMQVVELRGIQNLSQDETQEIVIAEQIILIDALVWSWVLEALDDYLNRFSLISVQEPEELVVDCTCGLGDRIGRFRDHHNRKCDGIGLEGRLDFISRAHATGELCYHEIKTAGSISKSWEEQWADKLQFVLGVSGAEARLEEAITEHAVYGLIKGARRHKDRLSDGTYGGPIIQDTRLVYPFFNPGSPPVEPEDWQMEYDRVDEFTGEARRLSRKYKKTFVGEHHEAVEAAKAEGMPLGEYWTRIAPPKVRQSHVAYIGPLRISQTMKRKLLRQVVAVERDWQRKAWAIYEAFDAANGEWDNPDFQAAMDEHAPCSWECKKYTSRYACQFHKMCFEEAGWDAPLDSEYYIPRRPHHAAELKQAEDRGLAPPAEGMEEDDDAT